MLVVRMNRRSFPLQHATLMFGCCCGGGGDIFFLVVVLL